jgi:hypothetical protein
MNAAGFGQHADCKPGRNLYCKVKGLNRRSEQPYVRRIGVRWSEGRGARRTGFAQKIGHQGPDSSAESFLGEVVPAAERQFVCNRWVRDPRAPTNAEIEPTWRNRSECESELSGAADALIGKEHTAETDSNLRCRLRDERDEEFGARQRRIRRVMFGQPVSTIAEALAGSCGPQNIVNRLRWRRTMRSLA